jgi:hypothetical protein
MAPPGFWPFLPAAVAAVFIPLAPDVGWAQPARLRVTFQPDCLRPSLSAPCDPRRSGTRLDLGPQIAVWIEGADGRFVDTLLVTNLTALLGIGNRPGYYLLPSGPKFPYGRRVMSLPVWAHRRGKLYDSVVMQDGTEKETWLGFHESVSSPDPYFCRPLTYQEIDVDAIACPTARFNSAKGRFFNPAIDLQPPHLENGRPREYVPPPRSYYPPRNDLTSFARTDCDGVKSDDCPISARTYSSINDLDSVAAATPPYGRPFTQLWRVPDALPGGDYLLLVEVNKEFDDSAAHSYPAVADPLLAEWGLTTNVGQPSVVFRTPFSLDRQKPFQGATSLIAGYGDWDGRTGTLHPPDETIQDTPGSGSGRLLAILQPSISGGSPVRGRVHVVLETQPSATPPDAAPAPPEPDGGVPIDGPRSDSGADSGADAATDPSPDVPAGAIACLAPGSSDVDLSLKAVEILSEAAEIQFVEPPRDLWEKTDHYEVRIWSGNEQSRTAFEQGRPVPRVLPVEPGFQLRIALDNLKSESRYTVGIRPTGLCDDPPIAFASFTTVIREFVQLSGCFIATAAYGGPLQAQVDRLRRFRDRFRQSHPLAAAAAETYARSSPPLAEVLRASEPARAMVRALLGPIVRLLP